MGARVKLAPVAGSTAFTCTPTSARSIQQVFKAYGIEATLDESVTPAQVRLDVDDASFEEAMRALAC